ncbi:MAG: hypothetical protein ACE5HT_10750 [Gemmatimonadales bacterium]
MPSQLRTMFPLGAAVIALGVSAVSAHAQISQAMVSSYLWPNTDGDFRRADSILQADESLVHVSRLRMLDLEETMRRGPVRERSDTGTKGTRVMEQITVDAPGGRKIPVYVQLPSSYSPAREWPLMFAMHGGPTGNEMQALQGAQRMLSVWSEPAERAGWIVAAPAMLSTTAKDGRTRDRLPYEIFHPKEAKAVIDALRVRYNISADRVVSTGISLGSNFSIGFAAAHPDWLAAIVPVSTEGDSRELLLRNLLGVPIYVLEGSRDRNIRGVSGPRTLATILTGLGYDLTYREFSDRAHEGFQEHYADVLRWLDSRPRRKYPREVLRVPHDAIMPVAKRVHWIETDTRQALVHAVVVNTDRIDITARWTPGLTVFLNDHLVNMDESTEIWVNGIRVFNDTVPRSAVTALTQAKLLKDERRVYAASVHVTVPSTPQAIAAGKSLWKRLTPQLPEGQLSFWEMYAQRAIEERFPTVGFEGEETQLPAAYEPRAAEQIAIRVTEVNPTSDFGKVGLRAGDLVISVGNEPFFRSRDGVGGLYRWLVRELRETPAQYPIVLWRDGREITVTASLHLGPYSPFAP